MAAHHAMGWGVQTVLVLHLLGAAACLVSVLLFVARKLWTLSFGAHRHGLEHGSRG